MTSSVIAAIQTRMLRVPLARPWGADVRDLGVVVVTVHDSHGAQGHGFSWTPSIGASAVRSLIDDDLTPFLLGSVADTSGWQSAWEHVHEAGGGGVTTIALAGIDLALWDLRGKREGASLASLLGRSRESQPVYGSGVNIHYSIDELQAQARRWVAAGYAGAKIKIGKSDLQEDLDRVAAVREIVGPDRALMVDANQRWTLPRAVEAAQALAAFDVAWLEEPLRADDTASYRALHAESPVPIALGENLHTIHRFRDFLDAGSIDVAQPNIVRVGGVTPFLAIAGVVRDAGVTLAPHLLPELSAQVAFALPDETWVEDVEDAGFWQGGALQCHSGVEFANGRVSGGNRPGLGLDFVTDIATGDAS